MDAVENKSVPMEKKKYKHKSGHDQRLKAAKEKLEKITSDPGQKKITWFKHPTTKR